MSQNKPGSVTVHSSQGPTGESNFVALSANGGSQGRGNNVLVMQEKSPYAVTLHNVDKFEQLTEVKAKKSKANNER